MELELVVQPHRPRDRIRQVNGVGQLDRQPGGPRRVRLVFDGPELRRVGSVRKCGTPGEIALDPLLRRQRGDPLRAPSRTATRAPSRPSRSAVVMPVIPPPITATSTSSSPVRGGRGAWGSPSSQSDSAAVVVRGMRALMVAAPREPARARRVRQKTICPAACPLEGAALRYEPRRGGKREAMLNLPDGVRACLFDLDGVLTQTAKVHAQAWK